MSSQGELSTWRYIYTHRRTEGATGYFSCEPELEESFDQSLNRLACRPMDSFLHQKLLNELVEMDTQGWLDLASLCLDKKALQARAFSENREAVAKVLSCLLLECVILIDACRHALDAKIGELHKTAGEWAEYCPFPQIMKLWETGKRKGFELYGQAIKSLLDLPGEENPLLDESSNEAMFGNLASFEKHGHLLRKLYAGFSAPEHSTKPMPAEDVAILARERLEQAGFLQGPEMRHEASLCPIALLRQWTVKTVVRHGRHRHSLQGLATAYGRGLSLAQARASCLMEIVERASAYISTNSGGKYGAGQTEGLFHELPFLHASAGELRVSAYKLFIPAQGDAALWQDVPLYWVEGSDALGNRIFVPAQAVFLFSNFDEPSLYEQSASTGLASGTSPAQAKLAALGEILERDANATSLHNYRHCFIPRSRDEMIQGLLDDYRAKRIFLYMQDIGNECAFPVYRCIVRDSMGRAVYATGASLDGKRAALSAITETPWPYSWSSPFPTSKLSLPPPPNLPVRFLEDLPNYSFGSPVADLALVEKLLTSQGHAPAYVDISRADLQFPVIRAFIPEMESNGDYDASMPPGPRFRARNYLYNKKFFK